MTNQSEEISRSIYEDSSVKIGDLMLESGILMKNVEIAYERVGPIDAPTILICHALTGNQYAVGSEFNEGWWSNFVGPKQLINTDYYQVITTNIIGGCHGSTGPLSHNLETKETYKGNFPFITVRDMVNAQHQALKQLGIHHLLAVMGGSLGGMQVLEWGILYPHFMDYLIPIAVTPYLSDYAMAFNTIARFAIVNDPLWKSGFYDHGEGPKIGLSVARMVGMVTYRSEHLFNQRFSRRIKSSWGRSHTEQSFEVESYLIYQGKKLTQRFDANSYLYLLKAMDNFDIGRNRGGWVKAVESIRATVIAVSFKGDLLYPATKLEELVNMHKNYNNQSNFMCVDTQFGHDGFLVEFDKWGHFVIESLNKENVNYSLN